MSDANSNAEVRLRGLFIDGREVPASRPDTLDVLNPATGELLARIGHASDEDVDRAVKSAAAAFESPEWSGMSNRTRARLVNKLAEIAGNPRMRDQLNNLIDQMERAVLMSVNRATQGSGNTSGLVEEHCRLIDSLQQRQTRRAERQAEQHIASAGKRVTEAISRSIIAA